MPICDPSIIQSITGGGKEEFLWYFSMEFNLVDIMCLGCLIRLFNSQVKGQGHHRTKYMYWQ